MKLLCDQMLGSLATWLRILGYDTFYAKQDASDDELLQIAKTEQRTLISRDKELMQRAKKQQISRIEIFSTDLDIQLRTALKHLIIDKTQILTRCILCNTKLESREKNDVKQLVPKKIFERHNTFWFCSTCKKVYWKGTHYDNMIKKLQHYTTQKLV